MVRFPFPAVTSGGTGGVGRRANLSLAAPGLPVREKWKLRDWRLVRGTGVNAVLVGMVVILSLLAAALFFGAGIGIVVFAPG